jgi:heme-degrading monooxygenase HmoA
MEYSAIHVLGEVSIRDLSTFISVFATAGAKARARHGCVGAEVFSVIEAEQKVIVLLAWESREAFEGFVGDAAVNETMKSGGMQGPPTFTLLTKVASFPI